MEKEFIAKLIFLLNDCYCCGAEIIDWSDFCENPSIQIGDDFIASQPSNFSCKVKRMLSEKELKQITQKNIVSCKDCKHRHTENCALYYGTTFQDGKTTKYFCGNSNDDNFYCAKGESYDL